MDKKKLKLIADLRFDEIYLFVEGKGCHSSSLHLSFSSHFFSFNFVYLLISYVFGTIAFLISWTITHTQSAGRLLSSPGFLCSLYAFDLCLLFSK